VLASRLAGCSRMRSHPAPHCADLPEPHHRHPFSRHPVMIINEKPPLLPGSHPSARRRSTGACSCRCAEYIAYPALAP